LCIFFNVSSAQNIDDTFFKEVDQFLKTHVSNGLVNYVALEKDEQLPKLIDQISQAHLDEADDKTKQAFYINAYNLYVIDKIKTNYPIKSVMDKSGFFDGDKIKVANTSLTLNQLEKKNLLKTYQDPRFHFVLVCGAVGCPPITNFAYTPENLETQLEQQTKLALNDPNFIKYSANNLEISEIFKWYASDFGSSADNVLSFINQYRKTAVPNDSKIKYYNYDWSLNNFSKGQGSINKITEDEPSNKSEPSNASRYVVSSTIPQGSVELKLFNNLYSQKTGVSELTNRSSFFTSSLSALYGLSGNFNIGLNTRFRKVRNNPLPSSPFSAFGSGDDGSSRAGLTAIGPQIRYAPVPRWQNFSIQSSFVFPIGKDLAGSATKPYIDWTGPTWTTQLFNDFSIGSQFSLFTELDFWYEDIGKADNGHTNRISTPATLIFSYIPTFNLTVYTIGSFSPYWQSTFDYFYQFGLGAKYQFTPNLELELLYSDFTNKFLNDTNGQAETINLGLRINL